MDLKNTENFNKKKKKTDNALDIDAIYNLKLRKT
jgi:hypothetical protein